MRILADLRSLQDPRDALPGLGAHAACLLRGIRALADAGVELIGLTDPALGPLAPAHAAVCDSIRGAFVRDDIVTATVFLQLAPMTHDTLLPTRLFDRANVMPAAVVHDFVLPADPGRSLPDAAARNASAAALVWLAAHRVFFPTSDAVAEELGSRLGISRRRMAVTGFAGGESAPDDPLPAAVGRRFWDGLRAHFESFVRRRAARGRRTGAGGTRPSLAIVTPFPPDRSGVADYTLRCVEALGRRVDVDIYTEQPAAARSSGVRAIHPLSAAAWLRPDYDATISVIGNSPFHGGIVDLHTRFGGPCILHDSRMLDFHVWRRGLSAARAIAERELGRHVSEDEVGGWLASPDTQPAAFVTEILANAHPAIVHSRPFARLLDRIPGSRVETLPFCVYRQMPDELLADEPRRAARRRLGIPDDVVLIVSLGWVIPSKAPEAIVDAVAALRRRGVSAHLRFVGNPGGWQERLTARAGGPGVVSFTDDWVGEADYRRHLQAADYAIQLRTHRSGQCSGGLIDCVAAGLPTVSNADLAAAVESPGYVLRVADALSADEITARLGEAIEGGLHVTRHADARRAYADAHSFDAYAEQLLAILGISGPRNHPHSPVLTPGGFLSGSAASESQTA